MDLWSLSSSPELLTVNAKWLQHLQVGHSHPSTHPTDPPLTIQPAVRPTNQLFARVEWLQRTDRDLEARRVGILPSSAWGGKRTGIQAFWAGKRMGIDGDPSAWGGERVGILPSTSTVLLSK